MAIAFGADSNGVDADGGTFTMSAPAGTAAGQTVIAALTSYDTTSTTITFTGWTQYRVGSATLTNSIVHHIYYRVLTGSDAYQVTLPATYTTWYLARYTGAHATTPLVDTGSFNSNDNAAPTGTGVTVTTDGSFLFWSMVGYGTGLTNPPAGFSEREKNYDGVNSFYDLSVSAGATGDKAGTMSSDQWWVTMGVIAPAAGGGGGEVVAPVDHTSTLSFPAFCRRPANDNGRWTRGKGGLWEPKRKAA